MLCRELGVAITEKELFLGLQMLDEDKSGSHLFRTFTLDFFPLSMYGSEDASEWRGGRGRENASGWRSPRRSCSWACRCWMRTNLVCPPRATSLAFFSPYSLPSLLIFVFPLFPASSCLLPSTSPAFHPAHIRTARDAGFCLFLCRAYASCAGKIEKAEFKKWWALGGERRWEDYFKLDQKELAVRKKAALVRHSALRCP